MGKIVEITDLIDIVQKLKGEGQKIVTTNGAFDILHVGHVRCLKFAKKQGDILIIGLNSDASIKKYKSPLRPIIPQIQRAEIVSSLNCVDYVSIFEEKDPREFLSLIKPNCHVKGIEYKDRIIEEEIIKRNGGKLVFREMPDGEPTTTKILTKIIQLEVVK